MQKLKTQKGITLIALIITIIIMLILVGVTVSVSLDGGLFSKAKEAGDKTQAAAEEDILASLVAAAMMNSEGKVNWGELENYIEADKTLKGSYDPNTKTYTTTTGEKLVIADNGKISKGGEISESAKELEVGDYVNYIPEGASIGDDTVYTAYQYDGKTQFELNERMRFVNDDIVIDGEISGLYTDETNGRGHPMSDWYDTQTVTKQDTNWQVLKNDGKNIYLISEEPLGSITLGGKEGYQNGIAILNGVCNAFYGSSIATVRSINEDDINSIFRPEFNANLETNWSYKDKATGLEVNFASGIRTIKAAEEQYNFSFGATTTKTVNGVTYTMYDGPTEEQYSFAPKYYMFDPGNTKGGTSAEDVAKYAANSAYSLVFGAFDDSSSKYWVATQCIHIADLAGENEDLIDFCLNYIKNGYMSGEYLHATKDCENPDVHEYTDAGGLQKTLYYRPIVVLNSNVEFEPATTQINGATTWDIK